MALQPAAGAKDLNPRQVETNRQLTERLASVFRLWGYEEVSPPRVERLATLMAGGAIDSSDIVRLVADDPLGLRPEMTASIARAACTRFADRQRPLRLWASGTVFRTRSADEGGQSIEENLQSGVELFGVNGSEAEMELLSLLMAAVQTLGLQDSQKPRLLLGHTALMDLILSPFTGVKRDQIRTALIDFDRLALESFELGKDDKKRLLSLLNCRGTPDQVLTQLTGLCGEQPVFDELRRLCAHLATAAQDQSVTIQLDPTFQPHFELYNGLVFQLVCDGRSSPVVIARGGRYDDLVQRCGATYDQAYGAGFSLAIDPIRELISEFDRAEQQQADVFVAFSTASSLESAMDRQRGWHQKGRTAVIALEPLESRETAEQLAKAQGDMQLDWVDP
jgi:ATP phosphoribosyltransferase regulatory subunit